MCKAKAPGLYAMRGELDVWYKDEVNEAAPVFDPSRTKLVIDFMGTFSELCEDGSGGKASFRICGIQVPPLFVDAVGGVMSLEFPNEIWDSPSNPEHTTTITTGFEIGDSKTIVPVWGLLGIELMDAKGAFPTFMQTTSFACASGTGKACFPDHDGDGKPGVTATIRQEGTAPTAPYPPGIGSWHNIPAPTDIGAAVFGVGAVTASAGMRLVIGTTAKLGANCADEAGTAQVTMDVETSVLECTTNDGSACTAAGTTFIDQNMPNFHVLQAGQAPPATWKHVRPEADAKLDRTPSKGPVSSVVRLGDLGATATCADVRNAMHPASP